MPRCPFPGLDPFVEGQAWSDFHTDFLIRLRLALIAQVRPRYAVRVEQRIYLEHADAEEQPVIRPDVSVLAAQGPARTAPHGPLSMPVILTVPVPEKVTERYLTVCDVETMEVVTIIELLSPTNKRQKSTGRRQYLKKRDAVLASMTHLVELDLLRGGARLPTRQPLPAAEYYAMVCRGDRRPKVEVYPWRLRDPMPTVPVPLRPGETDAHLDMQAIFTQAYEESDYDYSIHYEVELAPRPSPEDAAWIRTQLEHAHGRPT